jgi:DNA-directed RNA polymerase sigma subunit (sigma70/sigma32)
MAHRLGWHLIRRWGLEISRDDAESMIDYALCEALSRFDETRGAEFSTYLYYVLKGELKRIRRSMVRLQSCVPLAEDHDAEHDEDSFSPIPRVASPTPSPEQELHQSNVRSLCERLMKGLTSVQKAVVMETVAGDENVAGLARKLGYSRGHLSTVKSATMRSLRSSVKAEKNELFWENNDYPITRQAA